MFRMLFACLFAGLIFASNVAWAQMDITVGTVQRYFLAGERPFQTLTVTNHHEDKTFEMGTEFKIYKNIRDRTNQRKAIFESSEGHFMVAPRRFTLKPGESRAVRLVHTKPAGEDEIVYSLSFKPEVLKKERMDSSSATSIKTGAVIVTVAGMLVLASPIDPILNVTFERDDKGITFKNEGNIAADLRRTVKYCYNLDGEDNCMELPGKRIYPEGVWRFEIDGDIPLRWALHGYDRIHKKLNIPAYDE